ncbi:hypothetical protein F5Y03DRAFT_354806 [Xylaria venustula]|nr:hypothetical protein F5Y03DRAFT_354806 [Xylaria venustula]
MRLKAGSSRKSPMISCVRLDVPRFVILTSVLGVLSGVLHYFLFLRFLFARFVAALLRLLTFLLRGLAGIIHRLLLVVLGKSERKRICYVEL